jgi:PhnB protein
METVPRPPESHKEGLRDTLSMEAMLTPKLAPYLLAHDAAGLGKFIEEGIGGTPGLRVPDEEGKLNHYELRVADSVVMVADAPEGRPAAPAMMHLYVPNAQVAYQRALTAGATSIREPADAGDGIRGGVRDRWGNEWWFTEPK